MTLDFQSWMRAVWMSLIEPAEMARKVAATQFAPRAMWMALALMVVLNVLLLALVQALSPAPEALSAQVIQLSPFGYAALIGVFLVIFVFAIFYAGQMMDGRGTLTATLTMIVWFQAVSLTLEAGQVILVLFSPYVAALYGIMSLGALIWCIVNFVDVLHGFENRGKAVVTIVMALIGTVLCAGLVLALMGVGPPGGTT